MLLIFQLVFNYKFIFVVICHSDILAVSNIFYSDELRNRLTTNPTRYISILIYDLTITSGNKSVISAKVLQYTGQITTIVRDR